MKFKMINKKKLGNFGEKIATQYLGNKGYKIEKTNYYCKFGEIDIIARDRDGTYVFVEVKTRRNTLYGRPSEYVDYKKQNKNQQRICCRSKEDKFRY